MKYKTLLLIAALSSGVIACSEQKTSENTATDTEEVATTTTEEHSVTEQTEIPGHFNLIIEGNDQMQFNTKELKVVAGKKVVLKLKHTGKMPKAAMGHNWVLLNKGVDLAKFANAAVKAKETDYIPEVEEGTIIAHTLLIGGGEETMVEFVAPEKGEYDFICSFPGHYALMKGKLIVE